MSGDIHFKVDDHTYKEWQELGTLWHGIRSKIMRRKVREAIDEIRSNPLFTKEKKDGNSKPEQEP